MFMQVLLSMGGNTWLCWHLGGDVGTVARGTLMEIGWHKTWGHQKRPLIPTRRCLCLGQIMTRLANDLEEALNDPVGKGLEISWRIDTVQCLLGLPRSLSEEDLYHTVEELRWIAAQLSWLAAGHTDRSNYNELCRAVRPWVGCNLTSPPPPRTRPLHLA